MAPSRWTRAHWTWFLVIEVACVTIVFLAFVLAERMFLEQAERTTLDALHMVRGLVTAFVAIAVAVPYVRRQNRDLHDRERQWFGFLQGLSVAVFALDAKGRPAFANAAAVMLLGKGVDPQAGVGALNQVYPSFVAGTDTPYPPGRMPIVRALQGRRERIDDIELERDGTRVPIEVWGSPVLDGRGVVRYAIAVFFDISERRRLEAERATRIARETELAHERRFTALQRDFINHTAHQLYTPMTPLKVHAMRLRQDPTPERAAAIGKQVERLHDLISEVLRVAKLQGQAAAPEPARVSAATVFSDAVDRMAPLAATRGVQVRTDPREVVAYADPAQLTDALTNLLHNAIKFSEPGGEVVMSARDEDGGVVLEVKDDGAGWVQGTEGDLFEAFTQGPGVADVRDPGWGLGLYVARMLVEANDGRLEATSGGPGQGATLAIRLPLPASFAA